LANLREATVKILTEHPGILMPAMTSVDVAVQAVEVEVTETNGTVGRYLLIGAYSPPIDVRICDEIARNLRPHFKDAQIYFTTRESEGEAEVYVPAGEQPPDSFLVAAAAGVIKISWGWEEVNIMVITFAGESVKVAVNYNGHSWIASLADAS
jgi:hypothetical protein